MADYPLALFLMGPTAAGKTDLALALADALPCELISVDSALIYRGMDIGTAKPDAVTLTRYPHALIDIRDPAQSYSAAEFCLEARAAMDQAAARGKIPLLVGGTMLYYKVLLEGLADMPGADPVVRAQIEAQAQKIGWPALHKVLEQIDPESAGRINANDAQRLMRALEVWQVSGQTLTEHRARQVAQNVTTGAPRSSSLPYTVAQLAVAPQAREVLHQRIAARFALMLEQGFEAEVKRLYERGDLHLGMPSMRAVGYRQMWEYLEGQCSYAQMQERGVSATRQLAKRQLTWLRSWPDLFWLDSQASNNVQHSLKYIESITNLG